MLVNSAGITGATAPLHEYPVENWSRVIEVNLNGTFYANRAVAAGMKARSRCRYSRAPRRSLVFLKTSRKRFTQTRPSAE